MEKTCPDCGVSYSGDEHLCAHAPTVESDGGAQGDPLLGLEIDGRARVERFLGAGGMGNVYVARQLDGTDRRVAVKFVREELLRDGAFEKRFWREIRTMSSVNHKNVVIVYFAGVAEVDDRRLPYLAMELLEGDSLERFVSAGKPLPIDRALRMAAGVLEGLEALHGAGLVHRDLKLSNVFVLAGSDEVKILDFGLARPVEGEATPITAVSAVVGTPGYMSPEHLMGHETDARSDLYSFGVMLHVMVTGAMPGVDDSGKLQDPSVRFPQLELPKGLCDLLASLLALPRDQRPQRAAEALERLTAADRQMEEAATVLEPLLPEPDTFALRDELEAAREEPDTGEEELAPELTIPRPCLDGGGFPVVQLTPGTLEQASRVESVRAERSRTFEFIAQMWHPGLRTILLVIALLAALAAGGYALWEYTDGFGSTTESEEESGVPGGTESARVMMAGLEKVEPLEKGKGERCEG